MARYVLFEINTWSAVLTALQAPEGPHIYSKDGYYYLLAAEGKKLNIHRL